MITLYALLVLLLAGGLLLIFGRDFVWAIDSRSEAFERDEQGEAVRTEKWDRNHLMLGIVMAVVALVFGLAIAVSG